MATISIICPVYNAEQYIERCIDSIIAQTYQDWELIVVNDGSIDGSRRIAEQYAKNDIRIKVINKNNGGVSSARQTGLNVATGDYVIHADPDDWVEPSMLSDMYNVAQIEDADIVVTDFFWERGSEVTISDKLNMSIDNQTLLNNLFTGAFHGGLWNKLMKRSLFVLNNITFPEKISLHEDMYIVASVLLHPVKISYLNKAYYHYVLGINGNSISQKIGQSFEYDIYLLNMFDKLLLNNASHDLAYKRFAGNAVLREFYRHTMDSKTFRKKCFKYRNSLSMLTLKQRIKSYLACVGFYSLIYNGLSVLRKLKK